MFQNNISYYYYFENEDFQDDENYYYINNGKGYIILPPYSTEAGHENDSRYSIANKQAGKIYLLEDSPIALYIKNNNTYTEFNISQ